MSIFETAISCKSYWMNTTNGLQFSKIQLDEHNKRITVQQNSLNEHNKRITVQQNSQDFLQFMAIQSWYMDEGRQ